jgi:hypothetical protein
VSGHQPVEGRKFVYLDWSTFVEAFEGFGLGAAQAQRELSQTVHMLAERTNLCLSLTHTWELAHLEDPGKRDAFARWLDELDFVWTYTDNEVETREMEHAVLDAILGRRTPPKFPAAPSFLSLFHGWEDEALVYALGHLSLAHYIDAIANSERVMQSLGRWRQLSAEGARRFYYDRKHARSQVTEEHMTATLDDKLRALLEAEALQAAARLSKLADSGFHVDRGGGLYAPPTGSDVIKALGGFPDLGVVPYAFLVQRFIRNLADAMLAPPSPTSTKHRGDLYDVTHLVGAAYCDVFTCDTRTAQRLDGGREMLDLPSPISGPAEVVNRLIAEQL